MVGRDGINGMVQSDYFDKDVDFSGTDFGKNDYQLWVSKNVPKNKDEEQGFKAWAGQLIHKASYDHPEIDVIKEFSFKLTYGLEYTIGGSIDRLSFNNGTWTVEDLKSQGLYPAKKSFKDPTGWVTQLSIYAWAMRRYGMPVNEFGVIHQYVMGYQKNKDGMEEYNKITIPLMNDEQVEELIHNKIEVANGDAPLLVDCQTVWQCDYCSYSQNCPSSKHKEI